MKNQTKNKNLKTLMTGFLKAGLALILVVFSLILPSAATRFWITFGVRKKWSSLERSMSISVTSGEN
jgi:hypothetical protein